MKFLRIIMNINVCLEDDSILFHVKSGLYYWRQCNFRGKRCGTILILTIKTNYGQLAPILMVFIYIGILNSTAF